MSERHDEYVDGDVNVVDDNDAADGLAATAPIAQAALTYIATSMADEPDAVSVESSERQGKVVLSLRVAAADMGRIIGRRGRTAQAIRALIGAAATKDGVNATVDILD